MLRIRFVISGNHAGRRRLVLFTHWQQPGNAGANALTQIYDGWKVQAVLNEIKGYDYSGTTQVGTPAIFGMNFQAVSTAEKLPGGGYMADDVTPSAMLAGALDFVNNEVGQMMSALNMANSVIILSAKHGQSPATPSELTRIDDGAIMDGLDAAWKAAGHSGPLVAFSVNDDGMLIWTTDRSQAATTFAKNFLLNYSGTGNDIKGKPKPFTQSGLTTVQRATRLHDSIDAWPAAA